MSTDDVFGTHRCRLVEGSVRAVLVVMSFVLAENPQ